MSSRNPFRIRMSDFLQPERDFLQLFGSGVLDILNREGIWSRIQIIRSARGGGKTSLLRIFTPKSLLGILDLKNTSPELTTIFKKLEQIGAISNEKINLLGIHLSLANNYHILEQLPLTPIVKIRIFYALLTSRIILATLRSICELKKINYPDDLDKIIIKRPEDVNIPSSIPIPCDGKKLNSWAEKLEEKLSFMIDNSEIEEDSKLEGFESLSFLNVLNPNYLLYEEEPVVEKTLLMLDDVDKLSSEQRKNLFATLTDLRVSIGTWLAERLEALRPDELLTPVGTFRREIDESILLERFWIENYKKFERMVSDIADKRASLRRSYQITTFENCLEKNLDSSKWNDIYSKIINKKSVEIMKENEKYEKLLRKCENESGTIREKAIQLRILEIIIARDKRKKQTTLFPIESISENEFEDRVSPKEKVTAEFFLSKEFKIPYYFGFSKLASLSSSNVQQFLNLSSDLFDAMISAHLFEESPLVVAEQQEKIFRTRASKYWDELSTTIPNKEYVIPFLRSLKNFCQSETNLPNAPYAPGVTGIAISTTDVVRLYNKTILNTNKRYNILSKVLTTCISHNLLEVRSYSKQGKKDSVTYMIMYLNRLLCLHFDLPLNYGGWRSNSLSSICTFFEGTFKSSRKEFIDFGGQEIIE